MLLAPGITVCRRNPVAQSEHQAHARGPGTDYLQHTIISAGAEIP
jgi:hypothetical protein